MRKHIGLELYFPDDIIRILRAVDSSNLDIAREIDSPEMRLYRRGFEAALKAVARAVGVEYTPIGGNVRKAIPRRRL